ncbi:MAG: hypothetical protein J0H17_14945 [Rhizobiales bacterium]|nr:hypothetical protein [Hyphomicrobiales bacterium]
MLEFALYAVDEKVTARHRNGRTCPPSKASRAQEIPNVVVLVDFFGRVEDVDFAQKPRMLRGKQSGQSRIAAMPSALGEGRHIVVDFSGSDPSKIRRTGREQNGASRPRDLANHAQNVGPELGNDSRLVETINERFSIHSSATTLSGAF